MQCNVISFIDTWTLEVLASVDFTQPHTLYNESKIIRLQTILGSLWLRINKLSSEEKCNRRSKLGVTVRLVVKRCEEDVQ